MATTSSFFSETNDQDRLLDEATSVVKEQAFFMKRGIDNDNLREALKHSSTMICELRTSLLSPKNYYELYMQVFQEMQTLSNFFGDRGRHGRKMSELYESVQHAGSILPRMYLLATVGATFIKSKEAKANEILKDMSELTKGVQHPMRGLFLRHYLSQMVKDKLPDTGTEYEGEGGDINDAFDFIYTNFCESNRLWVRMQHQGGVGKDKAKREKERHDLRVLVGANLVRMSQLEGMTASFYSDIALPKILEHVITVKDTMSQQYLFESMIQVFPDEYHIRTLEQTLAAYAKAGVSVDMKPIMVSLMSRLSNYLSSGDGPPVETSFDIFALLRTHLHAILERALDVAQEGAGPTAKTTQPDINPPLELQSVFMQFTTSLYPDRVHYVDIVLGSTADIVQKYFTRIDHNTWKLQGAAADKAVELLSSPLRTLGLGVLEMEHYTTLMSYLSFSTRKQVALSMVKAIVEEKKPISSVEAATRLFNFISPLIKDEDDTPESEGNDKETFAAEQQSVARLVHMIQTDDLDKEVQILTAMRNFFGQGGPKRLVYTLSPTYYGAISLIVKLLAFEGTPAPAVTLKKLFQFLHKTASALVSIAREEKAAAEIALQLWLVSASISDRVDKTCGEPGSFELICDEFLRQALITYEEEISDSTRQFQSIISMVGTLLQITALDPENLDNISAKITQHAARLLKKPLQFRAVSTCSHLFWSSARRDGKRVVECLQKCLNIVRDVVQADPTQVILWVEMLDKYIYYFEIGCEEVAGKFINIILGLCVEHITHAAADASSQNEAKKAKAHLQQTVEYLKMQKSSSNPEVAARFAEVSIDGV